MSNEYEYECECECVLRVVDLADCIHNLAVDHYHDGSGGRGCYSWEWRTPGPRLETKVACVPRRLSSEHRPGVCRGESAERYPRCLISVEERCSSSSRAENRHTPP